VVASADRLILAADYSQLELRILAHLSGDSRLLSALNGGADVFRSVAASLHSTSTDAVTDDQRQAAKQICYGIVYGIGAKSLGEQLGVVEEEALAFVSEFKSTYSGVSMWMEKVVADCRKNGYVQTMNGRKRYYGLNGASFSTSPLLQVLAAYHGRRQHARKGGRRASGHQHYRSR